MTLNVSIVNGKPTVTDDKGNFLAWVHTIDFVLDPDGRPVLYLGTFEFSTNITLGAPDATPAGPVTPATPPPAPGTAK